VLTVWDDARPIAGTIGETYLRSRGLLLPERASKARRFHPSCRFGADRQPALVAQFRSIDGDAPVAIHRRPLTPSGEKLGSWQALGPVRGAAIKFSADEDVSTGLVIGEGVETVLAGMALGFAPAWALGSAGAIARFPVRAGIECLTILVDNDAPDRHGRRAGPDAARKCIGHWNSASREVIEVRANRVGQDIADVLVARTAA
jgi:hypothetical protein